MKKLLLGMLSLVAISGYAGYDLPIDGKFRHCTDGLPSEWTVSEPGASKIVRGEEIFSKALQLTAGSKAVAAVSKKSFAMSPNVELEVSAEIKGSGTAFIAVEIVDPTGKLSGIRRIAERRATNRFTDIKGKFRLEKFAPVKIRVILGVEPGSSVAFDDVEAELDND